MCLVAVVCMHTGLVASWVWLALATLPSCARVHRCTCFSQACMPGTCPDPHALLPRCSYAADQLTWLVIQSTSGTATPASLDAMALQDKLNECGEWQLGLGCCCVCI